ncbi:MAG: DUF4142 domain-containing protein [Pseudomonas sp.]|jgi:putative membrane protein|nr:DUF4142 domain-containing protein [Pseudomonas sp.]
MNPLPIIALGLTAAGAATGAILWLNRRSQNSHAPDPERFALEAAEGQWADMEAAQLALDTSTSAEVQFFAQLVLDNNRALNDRLKALADQRGTYLVDKADLTSILKEKMLALHSAKAFDEAYASQQKDAQHKRVEFYQRATRLRDIDLANFARQSLAKMREHEKMSVALIAHLQGVEAKNGNASGHSPAPQNSSMTQVTGSDTHLSKGVPQQTRGEAINPHH